MNALVTTPSRVILDVRERSGQHKEHPSPCLTSLPTTLELFSVQMGFVGRDTVTMSEQNV